MDKIVRIGEYVVSWHEGTAFLMKVDKYIELLESDCRIDFYEDGYDDYPVNSIGEAHCTLSEFERKNCLEFSDEERHNITTYWCLCSKFQDVSKPFEWEDILIR